MSRLEQCQTVEELAEALGTSYKKISYFYYKADYSKHSYYESFDVPKKSGGTRKIYAPESQLKNLQKKLAELLTEVFTPHACAHGFISKKSISTNANIHTRKKYVFNIDLENFFSTITFPRIFGLLRSEPYNLSREVASVIAHLCTLDGSLPQGAPTSPVISNMICRKLDRQLSQLARSNRANYSRYADDITFSFYDPDTFLSKGIVRLKENAGNYFAEPGEKLEKIIKGNNFTINSKKTRLQDRFERQVVTGLVVNKKINIPREFIRKTCAMIHSIEAFGLEAAQSRFIKENPNSPSKVENVIYGRILYIKSIVGFESQVYRRIALRFNQLSISRKAPISSGKVGNATSKFGKWANHRCWVIENEQAISQGSGFMVTENLLVTCAHVIDGATEVDVFRVCNDEKHKAIVCYVSPDPEIDIAILKIKNTPMPFEEFHSESEKIDLSIGEELTILGFPNHKSGTKHVNINKATLVNKIDYTSHTVGFIDKELYAGNSGGPVLNQDGALVGIVSKGNNHAEKLESLYVDHSAFLSITAILNCIKTMKEKYAA